MKFYNLFFFEFFNFLKGINTSWSSNNSERKAFQVIPIITFLETANIVAFLPKNKIEYGYFLSIFLGILIFNSTIFLRKNNYMEIYKRYRGRGFTISSALVIIYIAATFYFIYR